MGLGYETNKDEYDPEVRAILPRLEGVTGVLGVEKIVQEEFNRLFSSDEGDAEEVAPIPSLGELAVKIWEAYSRQPPAPG